MPKKEAFFTGSLTRDRTVTLAKRRDNDEYMITWYGLSGNIGLTEDDLREVRDTIDAMLNDLYDQRRREGL